MCAISNTLAPDLKKKTESVPEVLKKQPLFFELMFDGIFVEILTLMHDFRKATKRMKVLFLVARPLRGRGGGRAWPLKRTFFETAF